ncbi:MAG: M15 family metallopeptidase, partial [Bacteroidales bacterium]|nr:M15 family metallopeptidase [Bacteroidales bacterium]
KVSWFGQQIPMTKINGVADTLKVIAQELANKPHLAKYFAQSSSFYWRQVRGAKRQSAHSYGIAIDINVANSTYWLWANKGKSETDQITYSNKIPMEIVKVFEKHGFIWGGVGIITTRCTLSTDQICCEILHFHKKNLQTFPKNTNFAPAKTQQKKYMKQVHNTIQNVIGGGKLNFTSAFPTQYAQIPCTLFPHRGNAQGFFLCQHKIKKHQ